MEGNEKRVEGAGKPNPRLNKKPRHKNSKRELLAKISLHGKVIHVESPYSETTVERFRKLQGQWDPKERVWKLAYEHRDRVITILKSQGIRVDVDVPANLDSKDLDVREAAVDQIQSALSKDPRRTPISAKMMKQLTELGIGDVQEELKRKERLEKYGIDKTDWRINNINSAYWNRMKNRKTS